MWRRALPAENSTTVARDPYQTMLTPSKLRIGPVAEDERRLMDVSTTTPMVDGQTIDIEAPRVPNVDTSRSRTDLTAEISHAKHAFVATAFPIAITMILSSLASVYVKSPYSIEDVVGGLTMYDITDDTATKISVKVGESMANALIIVAVIAVISIFVLFLLRMGCSPCLRCYMMFASFSILSVLGGTFALALVDQYHIPVHWPSFVFVLSSFSIIGIIAIFYPHGLPRILTHSYLICTSVLLAWELSGVYHSCLIYIDSTNHLLGLIHLNRTDAASSLILHEDTMFTHC